MEAMAALAKVEGMNLTARQEAEVATTALGGSCAACHKFINPLGYALEGFDALGRLRTQETLFDEKTGAVKAKLNIDTRTVPYVAPDDSTPVDGAAQLVDLIVKSGRAHDCFARMYVRFAFARPEDPDTDACTISVLADSMNKKAKLPEVLRAVALTSAFQERTFKF
jgi:hypothetical protein